MSKRVKVGVVGYGVIGQRLADGVALQGDKELVGVADVGPTLSIRRWKERGMPLISTWPMRPIRGLENSGFRL